VRCGAVGRTSLRRAGPGCRGRTGLDRNHALLSAPFRRRLRSATTDDVAGRPAGRRERNDVLATCTHAMARRRRSPPLPCLLFFFFPRSDPSLCASSRGRPLYSPTIDSCCLDRWTVTCERACVEEFPMGYGAPHAYACTTRTVGAQAGTSSSRAPQLFVATCSLSSVSAQRLIKYNINN